MIITGPVCWTPSGTNQILLKHMQYLANHIRDFGSVSTSLWVHMKCAAMAFSAMMSRLKQGCNMLCYQTSVKFQIVMWQQCCPNPSGNCLFLI